MGNCCAKGEAAAAAGGGRNDLRRNRTRRQAQWEATGVVSLRDANAKVHSGGWIAGRARRLAIELLHKKRSGRPQAWSVCGMLMPKCTGEHHNASGKSAEGCSR